MGTCGWCGRAFAPSGGRGPAPKYCSRAHRQRAYEARRRGQTNTSPGLEALAETLRATHVQVEQATSKAAVVAAYHRLASAAEQVLGETSARPQPKPITVTAADGPGHGPPKTSGDPTFGTRVTLRSLTSRQVAAAVGLGASTTKTTATFVGHPAITLKSIQARAAAERAMRGRLGQRGRAPMATAEALERLATKYEAAIAEVHTNSSQ